MKRDPIIKGRFCIETTTDQVQLCDQKYGRTLSFPNETRANIAARFCRDYVRRWGDINFDAFPWSLDQGPPDCSVLNVTPHWSTSYPHDCVRREPVPVQAHDVAEALQRLTQ